MDEHIVAPFSARNRGAHLQLDSDFPESARTGLLHILHDLVEKRFVDWIDLARELQRITRAAPTVYHKTRVQDFESAQVHTERLLLALPWEKVFDFCERLHNSLARPLQGARSDVQYYIANELNRLFLEENLAFEFHEGVVDRRGRHHTATQVSRAQQVLGDPRLAGARRHFNKAKQYFRDVSNPDSENAVKEAVCAVEATALVLFPSSSAKTLGEVIKSITGNDPGQLPKAIANTLHGLYGFRSGGEGVGHGGASGGAATREIAEYVLAVAASQIILLVDLANSEDDIVPV